MQTGDMFICWMSVIRGGQPVVSSFSRGFCGLPFFGKNGRLGLPLPICHPFNRWTCPLFTFSNKMWLLSVPENHFLHGVSCAQFLSWPIIKITITDCILLQSSIWSCDKKWNSLGFFSWTKRYRGGAYGRLFLVAPPEFFLGGCPCLL